MKYILKEMPVEDTPRVKLIKHGSASLTDYELIAILLRTGTTDKSVIDMSIELLSIIPSLDYLQTTTLEELTKIKGIGKTKAVTLLACIELGKRINNYKPDKLYIHNCKDAYRYFKDKISFLPQEHFVALYLSINNEVIADKVISIGTLNKTVANPKDVIRWGIKLSSYAIIVAHNHPSGNSLPSKEDLTFTNDLLKACSYVDIKLLDHIVIGKNNFYSIFEHTQFHDEMPKF